MKKYPTYKNSGLAWPDKIPAHWNTQRLKFLAKINPPKDLSKIDKGSNAEVVFLPMEYVSAEGDINNSLKRKAAEVWEGFTYFERGDLLVAKITPCFENGKGAFLDSLETDVGFGSTEFIVLRANEKISPAFLHFVTKSYQFRKQGADSMTGSAGQQRVPASFVRNYTVGVPPLNEQRVIVDFLNGKLRQIDTFIKNKERLIELLREQKAVLIDRGVTSGLNSNVKLKSSGVEWLGDVPEHWERRRAKFFFYEVDERSESGAEELLSVSHITGVTPRSEKNITMFMAESYEGYKTCRRGDLVINIMWAWMGALGVSNHDGIVSSAYGVYRQKERGNFYDPYLDYLLRTKGYVAEFTCRSKGVTSSRARMYTDDFFDVHIVRPPYEEQVEIVRHIKQESEKIDKAIAKATQEIELIKEFRTTLISDAVTGKIDVRKPEAEVLPFKRRQVTPQFKRALLAAEIIYQQHQDANFGRIKFQKELYLCEYYAQLPEINSKYLRHAAGPYDSRMLYQIEAQLKTSKWFALTGRRGEQHKYLPLEKAGEHRKYFANHWGRHGDAIQNIIDLMRPLDWERSEIIATLFAAWNDLILLGESVTDDRIIREVMNWHESKRRIPEERWRKALDWMRARDLVPSGYGELTYRHQQ